MPLKYNHYPISVTINLPGSKSISNRLLILNEALKLSLVLKNISPAKDTQDLVFALNNLNGTIDVGHAGTDMRFLTALLSVKKGERIITGSDRMKQRPIKDLVDALTFLGAEISYLEKPGYPPLKINGKDLIGDTLQIESGVSSQFISALLLIAPSLDKGLQLTLKGKTVSLSYILMTIDVLKQFGVEVAVEKENISVKKFKQKISEIPQTVFVEPDWSSASYWFSIVSLSKTASVILPHLQLNSSQGDSALVDLYKNFGVKSEMKNGNLHLSKNGELCTFFKFDFTNCPDIAQTVAVTCLGLNIDCELTGLSTLKHKETDRLSALKNEIEKFDATVTITDNSLTLQNINKESSDSNTRKTNQITIQTYHDHRMAMSFAPLALLYDNINIEDPDVVKKSYPSFWADLASIGIRNI
ncbi:MAG: 3-phosphoshikimate 1-carboxyvinyltransferase [Bacteroidetes bacterium]|nr:3-phosphoshikimate 1-carboxyvinyltransferase [Bacteroidota bacterium]